MAKERRIQIRRVGTLRTRFGAGTRFGDRHRFFIVYLLGAGTLPVAVNKRRYELVKYFFMQPIFQNLILILQLPSMTQTGQSFFY